MKLRLRSLESRETVSLKLPSSCTLQQLKESLSQAISSSSSSLHFSLNRKDELQASSSQASLQSLGVTGGDLVYYTHNPTSFVSRTLIVENQNQAANPQEPLDNAIVSGELGKQENPIEEGIPKAQEISGLDIGKSKEVVISDGYEISNAILEKGQNPVQEYEKIEVSCANSEKSVSKCYEISEPVQETLEFAGTERMEIDEGSEPMPVNRKSEPYFLKRLLREELGGDVGAQGLVVVAAHSVLLESGFVGFDAVSGMRIRWFDLPDKLLSTGVSMSYTLQELLSDSSSDVAELVAVKYQTLGHFVNVYGCLANGDSGIHKVCLNAYKFGPIINLLSANSDKKGVLDDKDDNKNLFCGDEVFEFWKIVKDGLALPLLIDLCDKANLSLPPCMMRLPTELKIKILESLPGVDMAKMECVSKEMQFLAMNNDLWKQKFAGEFGGRSDAQENVNWKEKFARDWEYKKRIGRAIRTWYPRARPRLYVPIIREHVPFGDATTRGGDYDRNPSMPFAPFPFGQRRQGYARFNGQQNFATNCNLGGI